MNPIFDLEDVPRQLFSIAELDLSSDLLAQPMLGPWFWLAARTTSRERNMDVEGFIERQSFLLESEQFAAIFDDLHSIGNVIGELGTSGYTIVDDGSSRNYSYDPFYRFEIPFTSVTCEPLAFCRGTAGGPTLLVNPDLWLFLGLEERSPGCGIWWDALSGIEALRRVEVSNGNVAVIEIRVDYLLKYLRVRQLSLVVGHYRHLHYFNPTSEAVAAFVTGELVFGSPEQGAKALLQSASAQIGLPGAEEYLQRRLHLWFRINPPHLDIDDPAGHKPTFDVYEISFPTRLGTVAPARWTYDIDLDRERFPAEACDFMERIYFRQDVLRKYEGADGFAVGDDGSVSCRDYWGLTRSTSRLGNELLMTAIGDFAEGVPLTEWPYWRQFAVEPPSDDAAASLSSEQTIPEAVNIVASALGNMNTAFCSLAKSLGAPSSEGPWQGSLDSLAGRQLKWFYASSAGEDEFLKRATLASTFALDALELAPLRQLTVTIGGSLDLNEETPPRPLGSRRLLQRVTLVAAVIAHFGLQCGDLARLVREIEANKALSDRDLQIELQSLYRRLRSEFGPLAFLYDLRTFGGLAHQPTLPKARGAAADLGLPDKNWQRADYLRLMNLIARGVDHISGHFRNAARILQGD